MTDQPVHVHPGFKFIFVESEGTVETHMRIKHSDGTITWRVTHVATDAAFLAGEEEYVRCANQIRMHQARANIAALPKGRIKKQAAG